MYKLFFYLSGILIIFTFSFSYQPSGYYEVRLLDEVNIDNNPDAYPWISADGLRLYYTRGKRTPQSSNEKIYFTERESLNDSFGDQSRIRLWVDERNIVSCWLTEDELNIYYKILGTDNRIFWASRNAINEKFDSVKSINLRGNYEGEVFGPSLSPDKKELYLYNFNNKVTSILVFKKESELKYIYAEKLKIPEGYKVYPGQLSKDGLKYYLSLEKDSICRLYYLKRNSTDEKFSKLYKVNGEIDNYRLSQVSLTQDENVLIFSCSLTGKWNDNELYIAYRRGEDDEQVEY